MQQVMAESMGWSNLMVSYNMISADTKSTVRNMKGYSLETALPILAGLMTLPEYQSNCIRFELLVGLAVLHCRKEPALLIGRGGRTLT